MIRVLALLVSMLVSSVSFSQVTIYYDGNNNITMRELATHYRIVKVDTVLRKFIGPAKDYWTNDTVMVSLTYDLNGNKEGLVQMFDVTGYLKLSGQYLHDRKEGTWEIKGSTDFTVDFNFKKVKPHPVIDSLEVSLKVKESFAVSKYIRKADYHEIYSLIFTSYSAHRSNGTWTVVEERPYFPNGMETLGKFIGAFIKYPEEALKNNIKGQVVVEFTITEDGSTTDFKIFKGLGYGCDEEAIRVLKLLPDWVPGYQRGKAVRTKFKLPITFG